MTPGVKRARDIRRRIEHRMNLWYEGKFTALVDDTKAEVQSRHGSHPVQDDEKKARVFNSKVLSGRIRAAVGNLPNQDQGGVLQPDDACTKTGQSVLKVLRDKHPLMRDLAPDLEDPARGSFEPTTASTYPSPSTSPATLLRGWRRSSREPLGRAARTPLTCGTGSCALATSHGQHRQMATYQALMACRLVALDKSPGVRPVGIGEVYCRLLAKSLLEAVGHTATAAAGNLDLCAGLPSGIEGAIHAIRQEMDAPSIQPAPPRPDPFEALLRQPRRDSTGSREDADMEAGLPPEPNGTDPADPPGALLVDARNRFNELGR
jgi:hypothetical protein